MLIASWSSGQWIWYLCSFGNIILFPLNGTGTSIVRICGCENDPVTGYFLSWLELLHLASPLTRFFDGGKHTLPFIVLSWTINLNWGFNLQNIFSRNNGMINWVCTSVIFSILLFEITYLALTYLLSFWGN